MTGLYLARLTFGAVMEFSRPMTASGVRFAGTNSAAAWSRRAEKAARSCPIAAVWKSNCVAIVPTTSHRGLLGETDGQDG